MGACFSSQKENNLNEPLLGSKIRSDFNPEQPVSDPNKGSLSARRSSTVGRAVSDPNKGALSARRSSTVGRAVSAPAEDSLPAIHSSTVGRAALDSDDCALPARRSSTVGRAVSAPAEDSLKIVVEGRIGHPDHKFRVIMNENNLFYQLNTIVLFSDSRESIFGFIELSESNMYSLYVKDSKYIIPNYPDFILGTISETEFINNICRVNRNKKNFNKDLIVEILKRKSYVALYKQFTTTRMTL